MEIILKDTLEKVFISDEIFNIKYNYTLVHQVFISYLSNIRQNTKLNKNRSNVSSTNRKPWKQKGTGKSRAGSYSSPLWRSGGVTFGNQVINYKCKINKKMYKIACKCVLSEFFRKNKLFIFNKFEVNKINTKNLYKIIYEHCKKNKTLLLLNNYDNFIVKSSNNIYFLTVKFLPNINFISLVNFDYMITTYNVIKNIEKKLL